MSTVQRHHDSPNGSYLPDLLFFAAPQLGILIHWEIVAIPVRMRQAMYNECTPYGIKDYEVVSGTRMLRVSSEAVMR
jgi:hypothetical protein